MPQANGHHRPHSLSAREQIESEVERLIGILDTMDGDPDLEDCGDTEPGDDHASAFYWCGGSEQGCAA